MYLKEKIGLIFDLDGVIVDTAKYHYLAWKKIADAYGMKVDDTLNEQLKGVSRMRSLEIILEDNQRKMELWEREKICECKNAIYLEYIEKLTAEDILPGVVSFLEKAKQKGYIIALGSASKNAVFILERLNIKRYFDEIIDGRIVEKAKPNPEVFQRAATAMNLPYSQCIVFEDSVAGIEAAHRAGMVAIGIGRQEDLTEADIVMAGFGDEKVKVQNKKVNILERFTR